MKKLILSMSALALATAVNAQEFSSYKPFAGNFTTELGLTGGLFNSEVELPEGAMLKGRYFLTDNSALRLGLHLSSNTVKENLWDNKFENKGVYTERASALNLNLGYEKHFKGTNRLSPYVGADVLLGFGGEKVQGDNTDGNDYRPNYEFTGKTSNFTWGVRGVIGADYYFAKNVYLGVEAGWGFVNTIDGKTTIKTTVNGNTNETEIKSAGSTLGFAPSIVTGIRLGFVL